MAVFEIKKHLILINFLYRYLIVASFRIVGSSGFGSLSNPAQIDDVGGSPLHNVCIITLDVCILHTTNVGKQDDSELAYQQLRVGESEEACVSRAAFYWSMCGNGKHQPVIATFLPTGASEMFPPRDEVQLANDYLSQLYTGYNFKYKLSESAALRSMGLPPNARRFIAPHDMGWIDAVDLLPAHRGLCWVSVPTCHAVPALSGRGDDFEDAYVRLRVGESEASCLSRARFYWELCGADPFQQAVASFRPSGVRAAFPGTSDAERSLARRARDLTSLSAAGEAPAAGGRPRGGGWRAVHVFVGPSAYSPTEWVGQGLRGWMGECLQDYHAMRVLGFPRGGFFVDLAAHDAVVYSNTVALEAHFGWDGLCIEPVDRWLWGLRRAAAPAPKPAAPTLPAAAPCRSVLCAHRHCTARACQTMQRVGWVGMGLQRGRGARNRRLVAGSERGAAGNSAAHCG